MVQTLASYSVIISLIIQVFYFQALFFKKYTTSSDVWSYGMLMYEIWSVGERPFPTLNIPDVGFVNALMELDVTSNQMQIYSQLYVVGTVNTVLNRDLLLFEVSFIQRFHCSVLIPSSSCSHCVLHTVCVHAPGQPPLCPASSTRLSQGCIPTDGSLLVRPSS